MSWIKRIPHSEATGRLRAIYGRARGPGGEVDNVLAVHSLRPHTLQGHLALYKSVLHHTGNRLPVWLLETVGVHVSRLNGCQYCVDHHTAGLGRLLGDEQAAAIAAALESPTQTDVFGAREQAILAYVERLTRQPPAATRSDVEALRAAGLDDGEILEVNQVASYFAYVNRVVLGLGVTTEGDVLGLSPATGDALDDWQHH
ncbi:MAG: peroxidase-related enzyme [Micromonosporaceae bacterium]|nr:peroxidase-related enzyme [Micromonosporaceae bacterium]